MIVTKNERVIPCDIDDTLIMHDGAPDVQVYDALENRMLSFRKNEAMIRLLKEEKARGAHIIVWSRGGYRWAASVVEALGLEKYVDQIYTKPLVYFDDKDASEWMKDRVYLGPDVKYKR